MEDFFKQFRRNLDSRPEPAFDERDWRNMEKRLVQAGKKRPVAAAWWWVALPLLLLLLGSNAVFFNELQKANQKISTLQWRRDTIFQTRVIYVTDTIFQTRIHRETVVVHARQKDIFPLEKKPNSPFGNDGEMAVRDKVEEKQIQAVIPENQFVASNFDPLKTPLSPPFAHSSKPEMPQIAIEKTEKEQRKTLRHHLYAMRPKGFHLGFSGGWVYPFSEGLSPQSGWSAGIEATIKFTPNLQMWAGATLQNVHFEANRMGDDIGVPPVAPPSDDFVFVKAEVPQPGLQYSLGMQYLFRANKKWKPSIGVGYGAVTLLPYEVVYEFVNPALGIEWSFDKSLNRSDLLSNFLLLRTDLEYEFSRHWSWQAGATYRMGFGKKDFQTPDILGLQSGLKYKF